VDAPAATGIETASDSAGVSEAAPALVAALDAWGIRVRRDLPWRRTRDPWAVLVSETMLQQTQVARVVERFDAFLARYPRPEVLAAAPLSEVLDAWAGLGYYRRARDLRAAAQVITEQHAGRVPDSLTALRALPGVGAYTARAVLVFALEQDHGVVDTNAARVLARAFAGAALRPAAVQRLADALVPAGGAWAHNQAILDLGAMVCVARAPRCDQCPLAAGCAWRSAGLEAPDPATNSAGTSRPQSAFEGSDRQGRGRLLARLRTEDIDAASLAAAAGWPDEPARARRVAQTLVADGLAVWDGACAVLQAPR